MKRSGEMIKEIFDRESFMKTENITSNYFARDLRRGNNVFKRI